MYIVHQLSNIEYIKFKLLKIHVSCAFFYFSQGCLPLFKPVKWTDSASFIGPYLFKKSVFCNHCTWPLQTCTVRDDFIKATTVTLQ